MVRKRSLRPFCSKAGKHFPCKKQRCATNPVRLRRELPVLPWSAAAVRVVDGNKENGGRNQWGISFAAWENFVLR